VSLPRLPTLLVIVALTAGALAIAPGSAAALQIDCTEDPAKCDATPPGGGDVVYGHGAAWQGHGTGDACADFGACDPRESPVDRSRAEWPLPGMPSPTSFPGQAHDPASIRDLRARHRECKRIHWEVGKARRRHPHSFWAWVRGDVEDAWALDGLQDQWNDNDCSHIFDIDVYVFDPESADDLD
jgi:hypothetical protein